MAASLPREGLPPLGVVIVCFLLPLVLHLVDVGVAMREPSELGKLARLITVSSAGSRVRRLRAASKPGLSLLSVTSDLKLSSSYRNSMVKHEPELHTCVASDVCCQIAAKKDQVPFAMTSKGTLTRTFVVAGTGFEPVASGL